MSGETKSLKDALRQFVEDMPSDDELGSKPLPKGPAGPTTYPGRPNWCGGALLREGTVGEWRDKRVYCRNEAAPGFGLCHECNDAEIENRRDVAAKVRAAGAPKKQGPKRGFDEEAK